MRPNLGNQWACRPGLPRYIYIRRVGLVCFPGKPSSTGLIHRQFRFLLPSLPRSQRRHDGERRHPDRLGFATDSSSYRAPRGGGGGRSRAEIDRWATRAAGWRTSRTPRWTRVGAATCGARPRRATSEEEGAGAEREVRPRREAPRGRTRRACSCPRSVRSINHVTDLFSLPLDSSLAR
jgi:hypothetical protein